MLVKNEEALARVMQIHCQDFCHVRKKKVCVCQHQIESFKCDQYRIDDRQYLHTVILNLFGKQITAKKVCVKKRIK